MTSLKSYYAYLDKNIKDGVKFKAANGEIKKRKSKYNKEYYEKHKQEIKLKRILKGVNK